MDRGKPGSKMHVLSDANGLPLVVGVSAANVHDSEGLKPMVRPRLGGNGPFSVDRENERLIRSATSVPAARQVAHYERRQRREAHARNTAVKRAAQQRSTATSAAAPVRCGPSEASKRPE